MPQCDTFRFTMPTANRRIHVTLTPALDRVLTRLAKARKRPVAAIVRELLVEMQPGLQEFAAAVELVETKPREAVALAGRALASQVEQANQLMLELPQKRRQRGRGSG